MISYQAKRCGYSGSDMLMIDNEMVDHTQHHTAPHRQCTGKRKMLDYQVKVEIQSNKAWPGPGSKLNVTQKLEGREGGREGGKTQSSGD